MKKVGKRILSMSAAVLLAAAAPVAVAVPSASADADGAQLAASCRDWTPHIRRVIVGSAAVHTSYSGSSTVIAHWKSKTLFRVDKRCVNSAGNLWWHSDCCTGVKGWIWNDYTEFAHYN
ncbi:hypothetical protein SAMN05443665_10206 [Actinomadura meyerae]|jgi:hypothetical protein|uniref:SH3 domain-containing protein n=1 Tax=Actinomadura meyerae TaxID=240840 RepID=A0A239KZ93_9ACTN|nr:hypothetical protein [Actinomadura meyerae]SNT22923.1 hypothetical protein SAMN05443665_10206 [Actinomadura meyerae]